MRLEPPKLPKQPRYSLRTPTRGDVAKVLEQLKGWPRLAMEHYRRVNAMDLRQAMEAADLGKVPAGEVIHLEPRTGTAHK